MNKSSFPYKAEGTASTIFPNSAIMSNRCHYLMLTDVEKHSDVSFDPHEELETVQVPISELQNLVKKGEISHSLALNAIFHLQLALEN